MNRLRERAVRREAKEVIAEAEATLTGRLIDRHPWDLKEQGWLRLNKLAHDDWETLTDLADGCRCGCHSAWDRATMFLAGEIVSTAGSPERLVALQRSLLIPLESDLLAPPSGVPSTPADLVIVVRAQLARTESGRAGA